MTTFPISAGSSGGAAVATTGSTELTAEPLLPENERRGADARWTWRWFLGQPAEPDSALSLRRLPWTLPATKDIREHPLYGGALSRFFWRINNYRLTRAGRWFLGLTLTLGFFGATTLDIQTYIPFLYAAAFWAVALLALPLAHPRVRLRARHGGRVAAGTTLPVEIEITQTGRIPGFDLNVLAHRLPLDIDAEQVAGVPIGSLAPGKTVRVRLGLICRRRGVYRLQGWRVESDFPIGIMNDYRAGFENTLLIVYPQYRALSRLELPAARRYQPGGVALAARVGDSFEYFGNREFREGDNIRNIDWRATARMAGTPILREWREEYFLRIAVILDTFVPLPANPILYTLPTLGQLLVPQGHRSRLEYERRRDDFERAVSLCAAVSDHMAGQEYVVDLFAAGPNLYHLQAGRGLATNDQMLDILAGVEPSRDDTLDTLLPQLDEDMPRLTSIFCVFLDWNEERRAFAERLSAGGVGVKIVVARSSPTTLNPSDDSLFRENVIVIGAEAYAAGVEEL